MVGGFFSVLVLGLLQLNVLTAQAADEDWNFTRADYTQLIRGGGKLKFAADSLWFPKSFRDNLLKTLEYALDEKLTPSSTEGVNLRDFYHGHVGCNGSINGQYVTGDDTDKPFADKGLNYYDTPSARSLGLYQAAVVEAENNVGRRLRRMISEKSCRELVVVYHTFEISGPGMAPGDPRRNLLTRLGASRPEHYHPPDESSASSWMRDYVNVFQFAFLVDQAGQIHVTISTTTQLEARVMGRVPKF